MANLSSLIITSSDDLSQIKVDTGAPKESLVSLGTYLSRCALGANSGGTAFDMQTGGVFATQTLSVSSGVATDTAVIHSSTLTCVDHRETSNITAAADSAGSLNSTYLTFQSQDGGYRYYVWYNINSAGVDPAPTGRIGIRVNGATNASAATLATATVAACASIGGVKVSAGSSGHFIVTANDAGTCTAAADGTAATGFSFSRTITGSAVTSVQYNVGFTDTETATNLAAAINASTAISPYATATSSAGVVTAKATAIGVLGNLVTTTASGGVTAGGATLTNGANSTSNVMHCGA